MSFFTSSHTIRYKKLHHLSVITGYFLQEYFATAHNFYLSLSNNRNLYHRLILISVGLWNLRPSKSQVSLSISTFVPLALITLLLRPLDVTFNSFVIFDIPVIEQEYISAQPLKLNNSADMSMSFFIENPLGLYLSKLFLEIIHH